MQSKDITHPTPWHRKHGGLLMAVLLIGYGSAAVGSDFLNAIRAEIREMDKAKSDSSPSKPEAAPATGSAARDDQGHFEISLKQQLPGSYILYLKLGPEQRRQVLEEYQSNDDMEMVRERIKELFRTRN